jgi:hypothetical protein
MNSIFQLLCQFSMQQIYNTIDIFFIIEMLITATDCQHLESLQQKNHCFTQEMPIIFQI